MKWRPAAAAAVIAAVAAGSTYAATALTTSASATDTIQACVKSSGDVRIVASAGQCKSSEHAISWNVRGPKGEQGDRGIPGPKGDAGLSVQAAALQTGDQNCQYGGSSFTVGSGPATFACNGAPGAAGQNGKDGTSFTSIDGLRGLTCTNGGVAGTIAVSYSGGGTVTLTCSTGSGGGGGCTPPPNPPNGVAVCDSNGTVQYTCSYGWVDTDGNLANGCEQQLDLQNDPHNCGQPGNDVTSSAQHAIVGCRDGSAYIVGCDPGYADQNGLVADGCELSGVPCLHPNGVGGTYDDCADLWGIPGDASTYSLSMALLAGASVGSADSATCGGDPVVVVTQAGTTTVWSYTGTSAGHVSQNATAICPTATDPVWR